MCSTVLRQIAECIDDALWYLPFDCWTSLCLYVWLSVCMGYLASYYDSLLVLIRTDSYLLPQTNLCYIFLCLSCMCGRCHSGLFSCVLCVYVLQLTLSSSKLWTGVHQIVQAACVCSYVYIQHALSIM